MYLISDIQFVLVKTNSLRGEMGIVADAGIVADNDISRTIIVIKK